VATMRAVTKGSAHPDPVAELRFTVLLRQPDLPIGRFMECTGISVEVETKEYMEGGSNDFVHKLPTRVKYPNVVLKRGVTHEEALLKWFFESRYTPVRREMTITLHGPGGKDVRSWVFTNAYPVKWTGPNLNANSNSVASEQLEIVHNGLKVV
jgi:phage tail-like protein